MTKNDLPTDFNLKLALFDLLPVICFGVSLILISAMFDSCLFLLGSLLILIAGISKVLWKIIVVLKRKNIWFLFMQMRTIMPIGLVLIIASLVINSKNINLDNILFFLTNIPYCIFFGIGFVNMTLMIIFMFKLDNKSLRNNWIEETVNCIAQLAIMIGMLSIYFRY